jgi:hypothetical protein
METIQNTQGEKKIKPKTKITTASIRVSNDTKKVSLALLGKVNKKDFGRRVKPNELIKLGLSLIEASHIQELQEKSLSNSDRLDRDYRNYVQKNGALSKDEYLGLLLSTNATKLEGQSVAFPEGKIK